MTTRCQYQRRWDGHRAPAWHVDARIALTAVRQLQHSGARYALVTMCIDVRRGIAVVLERV